MMEKKTDRMWKRWNDSDNETLKFYYREGASSLEISQMMGRTFEAVNKQLRILFKSGKLKQIQHDRPSNFNNRFKWKGIIREEHEAWLRMIHATNQEEKLIATERWLALNAAENELTMRILNDA